MKEGKIRFNTVFVSDKISSDAKIVELKEWSEKFQKNGLTPEVEGNYTGNLSFRSREGFVITASGLKNKKNLADDCFVIVQAYDEQTNTFIVEVQTEAIESPESQEQTQNNTPKTPEDSDSKTSESTSLEESPSNQ